jgi:toxin ParE1/3/4
MTSTRLLWSPRAREDLLDLYVVIGLGNPAAAENFYAAIEAKVEILADYPRLGPRKPEIGPSTRILVEAVCLVLYETFPDTNEGAIDRVEIIRIVDGRRDLTQPF